MAEQSSPGHASRPGSQGAHHELPVDVLASQPVRDPILAGKLFWAVYEYLGQVSPPFVRGRAARRFARKFKRTIHLVDSTTIELIAPGMDGAKHRRRKARPEPLEKCHGVITMSLKSQSSSVNVTVAALVPTLARSS